MLGCFSRYRDLAPESVPHALRYRRPRLVHETKPLYKSKMLQFIVPRPTKICFGSIGKEVLVKMKLKTKRSQIIDMTLVKNRTLYSFAVSDNLMSAMKLDLSVLVLAIVSVVDGVGG